MKRTFYRKGSKLKQFLVSIVLVCSVSAICYFLSAYIGYRVVAYILLVAVSLIAMIFDILPVLFAALLSALIWNYFFIPPKFTFSIGSPEDALMFMMYFVIATVNVVLTYKIRAIEKEEQQKEEKENAIKLYTTLFNSLSHELQTPIATIIGATDTLRESENKLSDTNKEALVNEISIASLRLNEQVGNLLNMSRVESGYLKLKRDWCDVNELIYSSLSKIKGKTEEHTIKVSVVENIPLFSLDFGIMEQVLYNLLNNAIQYTEKNSVISITAKYTTLVGGHFDQPISQGKAYSDKISHTLILTVSDTGKGFPDNEIDKVFDKFYRLRNSKTGGTGLGLSIVKGFVEAHGGNIKLRNILGSGAEFTIEIPAQTSYINALKNE
jgi:two-component system sensor histidine kinase KdpD